jgi:hypothetical protein
VIAYIDGVKGEKPTLQLRLNNLKKGEYFILYRAIYLPIHIFKHLNIDFYSPYQQKKSPAEFEKWKQELENS